MCSGGKEMKELTAKDYLELGKLRNLKSIKQRQIEEEEKLESNKQHWEFLEVEQI